MESIVVEVLVPQELDKVWEAWTQPEHIQKWNFASDDWHCPEVINDLKAGGALQWRMESKDASVGFDFKGTYQEVRPQEFICYHIEDGRKVEISFIESDGQVKLIERFEPENQNSLDLQKQGWQAILENFKKHAVSL
ncbi:SRPBCC domain-containing protein [Croceimicrobium hydrocarbonivorans]|uniref:SRPBCC domain-containing protein n=1 Tax=Croceimicrobium hydrocarbonivorans TaxID=2761580 RepID=A0A7H0VFC0_9FLAO|nr:SRPBCC domain-containing protein [Croceimicrobium hydrocarbonivorans]QNR24418.1 SRPBCC domain-containing protein [Croceimicrobium hydrocarbonivorans]